MLKFWFIFVVVKANSFSYCKRMACVAEQIPNIKFSNKINSFPLHTYQLEPCVSDHLSSSNQNVENYFFDFVKLCIWKTLCTYLYRILIKMFLVLWKISKWISFLIIGIPCFWKFTFISWLLSYHGSPPVSVLCITNIWLVICHLFFFLQARTTAEN